MREVSGADLPECYHLTELFFGAEEDGRREIGRKDREETCKDICHHCKYEVVCLWRAMRHEGGEYYGVWGGMGEGDRREFKAHLVSEGYDEVPDQEALDEFAASWRSFWSERLAKYGITT